MIEQSKIPAAVLAVLKTFQKNNFEAFIVGGCVRDLIIGRAPKDWDITTKATPPEIQEIFPDSFYENDFGTVGIKTEPFLTTGKKNREHDVIEATTYRIETTYSDRRRPDNVQFSQNLKEDLSRRDFTMNALALTIENNDIQIVDLFEGEIDIKNKIIKAVGKADERFNEDALRMMRAIRFAAELNFKIEEKTFQALKNNHQLIKHISQERIQIEFSKIILSQHPKHGIELLHQTKLLSHIIPELESGIGIEQNHHHTLTVWEHNLQALQYCPSKKITVRLAALFHDIGKPQAKEIKNGTATFYNHEYISAHQVRKILNRLHYSKKIIEQTVLLVKNHMFYYNVGEVTEPAVRRIIKKVGLENIKDLIDLRIGDRLGSGTPKGKPYKLRHFEYLVEKVSTDPINVKNLKLNGDLMIKDLHFSPGPKIGAILDILLAEVIENPQKNTLKILTQRAKELRDENLDELQSLAKNFIQEQRKKDEEKIKKKYWVK
jgi:putative nucleotidyltransferase with HDIG domain